MALNFTVSYTFSPSTTISSSQVNTNTSDVASVFQGLEAETKSFAKLKVDIDPTLALEVATKQYVDHYSAWRRPNLVFATVSTVTVEAGLNGTASSIPVLFPDGTMRTETTSTRTTFDITRNAVLVTSGAQSGLTGATTEAANTWYALYACKVTDSTTLWVTVGSTVLPIQANFATLNTAYGTSGWVYLGMIRNGDNDGATSDILNFTQCGNVTVFNNAGTGGGSGITAAGINFATTASATTLSYTYSAGTATTSVPNNLTQVIWSGTLSAAAAIVLVILDGSIGTKLFQGDYASGHKGIIRVLHKAAGNLSLTVGSAGPLDIYFSGFTDGVLGVGSNPLL